MDYIDISLPVAYLKRDTIVVLSSADIKGIGKPSSATSIRGYEILVAPFTTENIGEHHRVCNHGDTVVGIIGRHD